MIAPKYQQTFGLNNQLEVEVCGTAFYNIKTEILEKIYSGQKSQNSSIQDPLQV